MPNKPYNTALSPRARSLRKNATKQENRLWYELLRGFRPRFTRQRIVGNYILDFYCGKAKLAIELDGSHHYEPEALEYDRNRTDFLESLGIQIIRYTNIDVDRNFKGVYEDIVMNVNAHLEGQPPTPGPAGPPPSKEGGTVTGTDTLPPSRTKGVPPEGGGG